MRPCVFQDFQSPAISCFCDARFKYIGTFDSTGEEPSGLPFASGYCAHGLTTAIRQSVALAVGSEKWRRRVLDYREHHDWKQICQVLCSESRVEAALSVLRRVRE